MRLFFSGRTVGQSLAEYVLLAALVGLATVGAVWFLALEMEKTVAWAMATIFGDDVPSTAAGAGAPGAGNGLNAGTVAAGISENGGTLAAGASGLGVSAGGGFTSVGNAGTAASSGYGKVMVQQVCYGSGTCVNMPIISDNWSETSGAMGSDLTHALADVFTQVANTMEASGAADSAVLNLLHRLANTGHEIGFEQKGLSDAMATHCPTGNCKYDMIAGTGSSAHMNEIMPDQHDASGKPAAIMKFEQEFSALKSLMGNNFVNMPPELKNLVIQQANQILTLAGSTPWVAYNGTSYEFTGRTTTMRR